MSALAASNDLRYVEFAYAQALVLAAVSVIFSFFRLGFLANFLSKAVLVGFISGLGIVVLTSQTVQIMRTQADAEEWPAKMIVILQGIPGCSGLFGGGRSSQPDHHDADRRRFWRAHQGRRGGSHFAQ